MEHDYSKYSEEIQKLNEEYVRLTEVYKTIVDKFARLSVQNEGNPSLDAEKQLEILKRRLDLLIDRRNEISKKIPELDELDRQGRQRLRDFEGPMQ